MNYAKPQYSREEVNKAGKRVSALSGTPDELVHAFNVIDNWRSSHSYPLDTLYTTLKRRASKVSSKSFTAQRIKRLASIALKLIKEKDMKLSQMQDIGGCRAILPSIPHVYALRNAYFSKPVSHKFAGEKDYISTPKETGYRGIHLKYRFAGTARSAAYDQLKIEMQLRTSLQHKWATAVEAAGTFTNAALKSNQGKKEWLRFFALMSSVFAIREDCPITPGTPSNLDDLHQEIRELDRLHHIVSVFSKYRAIIPHIENLSNAKYFLITLDPLKTHVNIRQFKGGESQKANREYTEAEKVLPQNTRAC